jgi:hypothetical protein
LLFRAVVRHSDGARTFRVIDLAPDRRSPSTDPNAGEAA